jgi:hypothetical protein
MELSNSLKKNNDNALFILCLVEKKSELINFTSNLQKVDYDILIMPEDLGFNDLNQWIFFKDIVTASTGLKAKFFKHIFNLDIGSKIVYLDPDLEIFSNFSDVESILDHSDIVLTPHLIPNSNELSQISEHEYSILRHGIFNLGFLALSQSSNSLRLLEWWDYRLELECVVDFSRGIFTDQKWIDQVPIIFKKVYILDNGNYNLSTWNVNSVTLSIDKEQYFVNGLPLVFVHHSASGQMMRLDQLGQVFDENFLRLGLEYESRVLKNRVILALENSSWSYDYYDDNRTKILDEDRVSYKESPILKLVKNPYQSKIYKSYKKIIHPSKIGLVNYLQNSIFHNKHIFRDKYQGSTVLFSEEKIVIDKQVKHNYFNIQFAILKNLINTNNPIIIHMSHGLSGGVERHVNDLISYTSEYANNILIYPVNNNGNLVGYHLKFEDAFNSFQLDFEDFNFLLDFLKLMPEFFIHWHHIINFDESLLDHFSRPGFNYGITFHDFYFITTNWRLIDENARPIEIPTSNSNLESYSKTSLNRNDVLNDFNKNFIVNSQFTISPSNFVHLEYTKRGFKSQIDNFIIPHLESNTRINGDSVKNRTDIENIRIAILGDIGEHKGLGKIFEFLEIPAMERPKLIFFGKGPSALTGSVDEYRGPYEDKSIVQKILSAEVDAIWLPFQSKETFSYVLGKAMNTGLHIFTTDQGAVGERLISYPNYTLMEATASAEEFIQLVTNHFDQFETENIEPKNKLNEDELDSFRWYRNTYINLIKSLL